jgi:hypothetical protein
MTPNRLRAKIIAERSAWISEMITRLRLLPLETLENFQNSRVSKPDGSLLSGNF